jgi:hypothetical protein
MSGANGIGLMIARVFGFKRAPARTPLGKVARTSERALTIVSLLYLALLFFPQVLFAYNTTEKGVTVYSRAPLPPEATARIDEAVALAGRSELAVPGRTERVFVCGNPWLFRIFSPLSPQSFATSWPVTDNIFLADADLEKNVVRSSAPEYNQRSFSGVAAHEICHGLIRHRVGLLRGIRLPAWIAEGYCDYIARESSFPEDVGTKMLREGWEDSSPSFRYFLYRQMVRHLIDDEHLSFDQVVGRANETGQIKADTVAALKPQQP